MQWPKNLTFDRDGQPKGTHHSSNMLQRIEVLSQDTAMYGKEPADGNWSVEVRYDRRTKDMIIYAPQHTHMHRKHLFKVKKKVVMTSTPTGHNRLWDEFRKGKGYEVRGVDTARDFALSHDDELTDTLRYNAHVQGNGVAMRLGKEVVYEDEINKGDTMVTQIKNEVKQDTMDMAQVTVGKIVFENGSFLVERFVPSLTWYEKLFTSKEKREIAVLVGSYIAVKAAQTKYNHYILDCLSVYLNFEMQQKLVGGLPANVLEKVFTKLEAK